MWPNGAVNRSAVVTGFHYIQKQSAALPPCVLCRCTVLYGCSTLLYSGLELDWRSSEWKEKHKGVRGGQWKGAGRTHRETETRVSLWWRLGCGLRPLWVRRAACGRGTGRRARGRGRPSGRRCSRTVWRMSRRSRTSS